MTHPDASKPQTDREWTLELATAVRGLRDAVAELRQDVATWASRVERLERWRWMVAGGCAALLAAGGVATTAFVLALHAGVIK